MPGRCRLPLIALMIDGAYVQRMARYNRWQNENLYGVADRLSDDRRRERGAWFGSIHKTLNHLLWGDRSWMSRFTDLPAAAGFRIVSLSGLGELKSSVRFDRRYRWADTLRTPGSPDQTYYSGATKREWTRPRWLWSPHVQSPDHHRGQVHSC